MTRSGKCWWINAAVVAAWVVGVSSTHAPCAAETIAASFQSGVNALAADSMEGRGLGTAGIVRAASWIERELKARGFRPLFGKSYRQPFDVKTGVSLADGNRLDGVADSAWTPLGFSSSGAVEGDLAFAGYGIDAPSIGYREFEGVDLRGKVALLLRYEPQEKDEASPFDGKKPSRWSALRYKVLQARERGATAVIFVTGPLQDEGKDKLPALKNDGPESAAGIPVIQVKTSVAQAWLARAGVDLKKFQEDVDHDLTPRPVSSVGVRISGRVALAATYAKTENLGGLIPGRGALAKEYVVIGAHYDHLGYGGEHSMRPNEHAIHNGADDNASGSVAAMLIGQALERELAKSGDHRGVVIALFSAEEVGLGGSAHFVKNPPIPLERVAAMVNLDMVGRLRNEQLTALGSETAPQWKEMIERAAKGRSLEVKSSGDGYGPSDQTSFYAAGIPVLHLFTGAHDAYHTPDDKPATVNAEGAAQVVEFASALGADLAREPTRPMYVRATSGPAMSGDSRGYGAYLGTIPDYSAMEATEGGVLLSDVRPGGPADRAGIRGKDRIVEMAGTKIENLYDMTYALQDHKPGETIDVIVIREGQRATLRATLGERGAAQNAPAALVAAATPTSTAAAAPPPSPHGAVPEDSAGAWRLPAFYEGRPGPDFRPKAGTPFGKAFPEERHLKDIRQLTFGGENAEPYFSPDGRHLIFQATVPGAACDQQYTLDLATGVVKMVSTGRGRTTCGYYDYPEGDRIVFASTHEAGDSCPPRPDFSQGYVWALYEGYDIYEALPDGSGLKPITRTPGYDAEATWCHRGGKLVFTSMRDGDLDLYSMDEDGNVKRLTDTPGYDGGAFYSPDCSEIVWRASRPEGEALADYRRLLAKGLIRPKALEICIMKSDGSAPRRLTSNGAANFCPTFLADGNRIIYSSNVGADAREFDLWLIDKRGGDPERVTTAPGFDGFPHFSPDGRWIVWASNRAAPETHETNLFIARWAD